MDTTQNNEDGQWLKEVIDSTWEPCKERGLKAYLQKFEDVPSLLGKQKLIVDSLSRYLRIT